MTEQNVSETHIEAGLLASFVDGRLGTADAAAVEAHLDACAECRREWITAGRLLSPRPRRWVWPAAAAMAAAAVLLLIVGAPPGPHGPAGPSIRGGGSAESLVPAELAPTNGATVPGGAMTFVWHSVSGSGAYRLTLTDERGDMVWTTESTDTSVAPPTSVRLLGGHTYYWSVDVLLRDGRSTTSGFHRFQVSR